MKLALFNSKPYDIESFRAANAATGHELVFIDEPLSNDTAHLAVGIPAICVFVNDAIDEALLRTLHASGTRLITLRCAGYNNVDTAAAQKIGIQVANVPAYSPYAIAEHTISLILALNRHTTDAHTRVHTGNFSLQGLKGFDLHGKTAGIVGTGRIGALVTGLLKAFGMQVLASDPIENSSCCEQGIQYVDMQTLLAASDIISLHCPLTADSCYLIDAPQIAQMKNGVMLINTSRGAILNTPAAIEGLKSGKIGYLGLDVYEHEQALFFQDLSETGFEDAVFKELTSLPNVLVTPHQAFFTNEALENIASATLATLREYEKGQPLTHGIV